MGKKRKRTFYKENGNKRNACLCALHTARLNSKGSFFLHEIVQRLNVTEKSFVFRSIQNREKLSPTKTTVINDF